MYIDTITYLQNFISAELKHKLDIPSKAVWRFVYLLTKDPVGKTVVSEFSKALSDPSLAEMSLATMIQKSEYLMFAIREMAGIKPATADRFLDLIKNAKTLAYNKGMNAMKFDYLFELRNSFVHSGRVAVNAGGFDAATLFKSFPDPKASPDKAFLALASLVMSCFLQYFYLCNPVRVSKGFLLETRLEVVFFFRETMDYIARGWQAVASVFSSLKGVVLLVIEIAWILILFLGVVFLIGMFNSCLRDDPKVSIVDIDPAEICRRVEDMTPYEQAFFIDKRAVTLAKNYLPHEYGDSVLRFSDARAEELRQWAIDNELPDPWSLPARMVPYPCGMARTGIFGWLYNKPGEPQLKDRFKDMARDNDVCLPTYDDGFYPLFNVHISDFNWDTSDERIIIRNLGHELAAYPDAEILILSHIKMPGEDNAERENEDRRTVAKKIKEELRSAGVKASRINIVDDPHTYTHRILVRGI